MFGVFVAISSRSDIAIQAHRSCQGLLGLFLSPLPKNCPMKLKYLQPMKQAQESLAAAMSLSGNITS